MGIIGSHVDLTSGRADIKQYAERLDPRTKLAERGFRIGKAPVERCASRGQHPIMMSPHRSRRSSLRPRPDSCDYSVGSWGTLGLPRCVDYAKAIMRWMKFLKIGRLWCVRRGRVAAFLIVSDRSRNRTH